MDLTFLIIMVVVLVITGLLVFLAIRANERRRKRMREKLQQAGYSVQDVRVEEDLAPFVISRFGETGTIDWRGMQIPVNGGTVTIFDYLAQTIQTRGGKSQITQADHQTILLFDSERLDLPSFSLYPEKYKRKFGQMAGQQEVDFEQNTAFPKGYVLQAADEAKVRTLLSSALFHFINEKDGLCVEGAGQKLLVYRPQKVVKPDQVETFLKDGITLLELLSRS